MATIIAEIGFNHEGDMGAATEMIRAAAEAGADAVKFQTFRAIDLALPSAPHYQAVAAGELSLEQHLMLNEVAKASGVRFLSTPFSSWAIDVLEKVGVPAYKVASMDCENHYLLRKIARTGKPVYLSTGMATLAEIAQSLEFLRSNGAGPVTVLHCVSFYPATAEQLNLAIIPFLKELLGVPVGYSDHYPGNRACLAAVMLGAEVVETHFTLDCGREGGDHGHSADPKSLAALVEDVRLFEAMKGEARAIYNRPDRHFAKDYRRGVYAARDLACGEPLREEDLLFCRPASRLSPGDMDAIMGMKLARDVGKYAALRPEELS